MSTEAAAVTLMDFTCWECPHCGASQHNAHPKGWEHILATCDIDAGGCGRTVIVDVAQAQAYRAIKSLDPACAPLVDVDREYVYPPGSEGIVSAADQRHNDHEARLRKCEADLKYLMQRFQVTRWEERGR